MMSDMATTLQPRLTDGPFGTREQAAIRYAGYAAAACGQFGPGARLGRDTLTDTLDTVGAALGDYDRVVLARVAELLDPVECAVLNSLFQRAARDTYDETVHIASPDLRPEEDQ